MMSKTVKALKVKARKRETKKTGRWQKKMEPMAKRRKLPS